MKKYFIKNSPMQKTCKKCSKIFEITKEDLEFYKKVSPKI